MVALFVTILIFALAIIFILTFEGCFASVDVIAARDYQTWTAEECIALVMANARHNLRDDGQVIRTIVTPFTPNVVKAIGRLRQLKGSISDSLTYEFVQRLTKDGVGTFVDRGGAMWDKFGNRHRGAIDSLMALVSLTNVLWPCEPPTINGIPIMNLNDVPCATPDISGIEQDITCTVNGVTYGAATVYGRRNSTLTTDEHLLVVFHFPEGSVSDTDALTINIENHFTTTFAVRQ